MSGARSFNQDQESFVEDFFHWIGLTLQVAADKDYGYVDLNSSINTREEKSTILPSVSTDFCCEMRNGRKAKTVPRKRASSSFDHEHASQIRVQFVPEIFERGCVRVL